MPKFFPWMVTELDPVFALLNEVRTLREPKSHENTCETNADSELTPSVIPAPSVVPNFVVILHETDESEVHVVASQLVPPILPICVFSRGPNPDPNKVMSRGPYTA